MNEVNSLLIAVLSQTHQFFVPKTLFRCANTIRFSGQLKPFANKDSINNYLGICLKIIRISYTMTYLSLQPNPLPPADPLLESSVALEWFGLFAKRWRCLVQHSSGVSSTGKAENMPPIPQRSSCNGYKETEKPRSKGWLNCPSIWSWPVMQRTASKIRTIAGQGMLLEEPMQCDQEVVRLLGRSLLRQLAAGRHWILRQFNRSLCGYPVRALSSSAGL